MTVAAIPNKPRHLKGNALKEFNTSEMPNMFTEDEPRGRTSGATTVRRRHRSRTVPDRSAAEDNSPNSNDLLLAQLLGELRSSSVFNERPSSDRRASAEHALRQLLEDLQEGSISSDAAVSHLLGRKGTEDTTSERGSKRWPKEPQPSEGSLLSDVANDTWSMARALPGFVRTSYGFGKYILVAYIAWIILSTSFVRVYTFGISATTTVCSTPFIGSYISWCPPPMVDASLDVSRAVTSQAGLLDVMDQVGRGYDLARDMVFHEFAVRDLKVRVATSDLPRKQELARELEALIRDTKKAAKGLSRFTARVGKSIDTAKTFDEYAAKALEDVAERQRNPPTLPSRVFSAIRPFAAFDLVNPKDIEKQIKKIFINTVTRISDKVKLLIDDAFELSHNLDTIQETLDRIQEIVTDEVGDLPRMDILGELWNRLAHPDDHERYQSHATLLKDMTTFYGTSSNVMKVTTSALNHVEAELGEFRDDLATPGLTLQEYPVEVLITMVRQSAERLEAGKWKFQKEVERGPQVSRVAATVKPASATP